MLAAYCSRLFVILTALDQTRLAVAIAFHIEALESDLYNSLGISIECFHRAFFSFSFFCSFIYCSSILNQEPEYWLIFKGVSTTYLMAVLN